MIVVTGGAGFIGSNLVAALSDRDSSGHRRRRREFGDGDKWRNIAKHEVADIVRPDDLVRYPDQPLAPRRQLGTRIEAVVHLGANSSTTETDVDLILRQNYAYSMRLWRLCSEYRIRLIYASSAATYGDGGAGFDDVDTPGRTGPAQRRSIPMAGASICSISASRGGRSRPRPGRRNGRG